MEDVAKIKLQFVKKENLISAPISAEISNRRPGACSRKYGIYALLTKREVKIGWILDKFFFAFLRTETK